MTEVAYGALGLNTYFGTPRTPLCVDGEHVAGGSSSGAAVSVALGFVDFALCSDTSGSVRIPRSEEHTSELQSLMRISYAVFCLKKKNNLNKDNIMTKSIQSRRNK